MDKNSIELQIKVPNKTEYLSLIGKIGEDIANELNRYAGNHEILAYHINLALTEAMANAIKYASNDKNDNHVDISITTNDYELTIKVTDYGQGFDINAIPTPDVNILDEHGRGIFLIKAVMDNVSYSKENNGNVLKMCKKLTA
ncbi:MAG: ATP-binding protein [Desulfuromonadales bacterium]|nr:ATP-binding protein [Desulfuromonadales bacterium]